MCVQKVKIQLVSNPQTFFEQDTKRYTFLNLVKQVGEAINPELPETFLITSEDIGYEGDNVINYIIKCKFRYDTGIAEVNTTKRTAWESGKWSRHMTDLIWTRKDELAETKHIYFIETFQAHSPWFDGEEVNFSEFVSSKLLVR